MEHIFKFASNAGAAIQTSATQACGSSCGNGNLSAIFASITNALMFVIGAVSVVMLIVGGLRFVTSNGDPGSVKSARETILYSVVGIIVATMAYAIVSFITGKF